MKQDIADHPLIDVRGIDLADLRLDDTQSGLSKALERLLAGNADSSYNSFDSSI